MIGVKLHQYFYVKYRIRLLYPKLRAIIEYQPKGHCKYYPIGEFNHINFLNMCDFRTA